LTPETALLLEKAQETLVKGRTVLKIGFPDEAGRFAYLAAFHAAQALISERTGRTVKTHNGVQATFSRLLKDSDEFDPELGRFLSRGYRLKTIADYEVGPDAEVSVEEAERAIAAADRFVRRIADILTSAP
jgi:uncharacterized protein (UPF0332 family)